MTAKPMTVMKTIIMKRAVRKVMEARKKAAALPAAVIQAAPVLPL